MQAKLPQPKGPQQKSPQKALQSKRYEDFDDELMGKKIAVKLCDGEWVTGVVTDCSRFWIKMLLGSTITYINKSSIVRIELDRKG
ncbi:MAG: hypothetical protein QXF05_04930 [Thermofilaceae archaeon]